MVVESIERKECLYYLPPERGFVAAQTVEREIRQVGVPQGNARVQPEGGWRVRMLYRGDAPLLLRHLRPTAAHPGSERDAARTAHKQAAANRPVSVVRGAAQPPQQAGEPQHQLSLDGRLGIVIGRNGRFGGHIVLSILCADYGFGRKTMADGIAAGSLLAFFRYRFGALERTAPVGCDLA
jgi:hypothetical protein